MKRVVLGFLLGWLAAGVASAEVRFLDDRGEPITGPLEACFQTGRRTECVNSNAGEGIAPPEGTLILHIEGPGHGPVALRYEALEAREGHLFARVPRKALLKIEKLPTEPLIVSLFDKRAASFDKPAFTAESVGVEGIKVPAGDFLVSLASGRQAPDLYLLSLPPGSETSVEYRSRRGWSLVLRCRGSKSAQPLASSSVSLESVLGYDAPNRRVEEAKTGEDGLAVFSGLAGRTVAAGVSHAEYLPQKVQGLSAAPGKLAFREVVLEEGGRVRAKVRVDGQARAGIRCQVLDPQAANAKASQLDDGMTNQEGICRSEKLPAGSYLFSVRLPENAGRLSRTVHIENGSELEEDFTFTKIRLVGKVSRGSEPAPGFMIRALEYNEDVRAIVVMGESQSGEDGLYEITLWQPGSLGVALYSSSETFMPLMEKKVVIEPQEEAKTVDFSMERDSIRGKVVDEKGNPLAKAGVTLRWNGEEKWAATDEKGAFEFFLDAKGKGDVEARKRGYRTSPFQEIALSEDAELPPVTLVLEKEQVFKGTLSSAAGLPVVGGWIGALKSYLGDEGINPQQERTDAEGKFEITQIPGVRNRLFASGPGCPLSFFEPFDSERDLALRCQGQPAVLDLTLTDSQGNPVPSAEVILRQGNVIIPRALLGVHLHFLGLQGLTDASGRLVIPNLAPGDYDVFFAKIATEGMIEAGSRTGYLQTVRLMPLSPTKLTLTAF